MTEPDHDLVIVRHADAGDPEHWEGDDALRPLSKKGFRQAEELVHDEGLRRAALIVSSPSLRCMQTIEPLARDLGLGVEGRDWLLPGRSHVTALDGLIEMSLELRPGVLVACSHGDILEGVVARLAAENVRFVSAPVLSKGASMTISMTGSIAHTVSFRPPPSPRSSRNSR